MTAQRQERKPPTPRNGLDRRACGADRHYGPGRARRRLGATTERVVVNRYSGVAIEGFDPVAYFTDARPVLGMPDYEAAAAGAVWRFRNESNRAPSLLTPKSMAPSSAVTIRPTWLAA